jgi:N-acetyl-anhydromuramyl-L-alanine amidase AmpD
MSAPELLKAAMPMVRAIENELAHYGYAKGTSEYAEHFNNMLAFYRKFGMTFSVK